MKPSNPKSTSGNRALAFGIDREETMNIAIEQGLPRQVAWPTPFCIYTEEGKLSREELTDYVSHLKHDHTYFVKIRNRYYRQLFTGITHYHLTGKFNDTLIEYVLRNVSAAFGRRGFANYFDTALLVLPDQEPAFLWQSLPRFNDPLLPPPIAL